MADDDVAYPSGYRPRMAILRVSLTADRGRLVHYLVALAVAVHLVVEMATNEEAPGSVVVLSAVAAVALYTSGRAR